MWRCDDFAIKHCAIKEVMLGQQSAGNEAAGACKHLQVAPLAHCRTSPCSCLTELHELLAGTEQDRQHEYIIQQALSGVIQAAMHPRTAISVILQVWQPGRLSASVSCMCSQIYHASAQKIDIITECDCRCWRMMVASWPVPSTLPVRR